jgi:hypothetical protein
MLDTNDHALTVKASFGYREAIAQVTVELAAAEINRLETERAAWRARCRRRSVLLDDRGLALAA